MDVFNKPFNSQSLLKVQFEARTRSHNNHDSRSELNSIPTPRFGFVDVPTWLSVGVPRQSPDHRPSEHHLERPGQSASSFLGMRRAVHQATQRCNLENFPESPPPVTMQADTLHDDGFSITLVHHPAQRVSVFPGGWERAERTPPSADRPTHTASPTRTRRVRTGTCDTAEPACAPTRHQDVSVLCCAACLCRKDFLTCLGTRIPFLPSCSFFSVCSMLPKTSSSTPRSSRKVFPVLHEDPFHMTHFNHPSSFSILLIPVL